MSDLQNKTVFLTGANGGFGQHFVRQLLAHNCKLILTDLDGDSLTKRAAEIHAEVGQGEVVGCIEGDLSTREGVDAVWDEVVGFGRKLDILINNAGIGLMSRHDEMPTEAWERLMYVNLMAPMRLCALATPAMIEQRSGHIINISSLAGWISDTGLSAYSATKFGLRGFSQAISEELAPHNVQVSVVCPFYSDTPIIDSPRFGTLADEIPADIDRTKLTDPADVVARSLAAVEKNRLLIFPDTIGRIIYMLQRYFPPIFKPLKRLYAIVRVRYLAK